MTKEKLISISELAYVSRVSRTALLYYDKMGIISPAQRGDNGYRYYSERQVASVNLVNVLKELGMSLKDIQKIVKNRTPEIILQLIFKQQKYIDGEIKRLERSKILMSTLKSFIEGGMSADEDFIEVRDVPEEAIFLGPEIDYSDGKNANDALPDFYRYCKNKFGKTGLNYPVWGMYTEDRIKTGDWVYPSRYYFKIPCAKDIKQAGLYAVAYARGGYGETDKLYKRLMKYINDNGFEICGPAYEEYPLNEIAIDDPHRYLIRVSIAVREK